MKTSEEYTDPTYSMEVGDVRVPSLHEAILRNMENRGYRVEEIRISPVGDMVFVSARGTKA